MENYISVHHLCELYQAKVSFFRELNDEGLLEIVTLEDSLYLHKDTLHEVDKIIRIHRELNVNIEGVDVVLNLLNRMEQLQAELNRVQSRLRLYEEDF
jgi:hypothetical protein